jgi:beta-glucosidase
MDLFRFFAVSASVACWRRGFSAAVLSLIALPITWAQAPSNAQLADPAIEQRANDLLHQMTLEEKIGQLVQYNDATPEQLTANTKHNPDDLVAFNPTATPHASAKTLAAGGGMGSMLNVTGAGRTNVYQHLAVEKSRLHIPLLFGADIIHGYRTIYPVPLALGASFDPTLVRELSHMSAAEARTAGVRWFYSPMVDISRDARWGRSTEGAGEDPYLGSAMARAYIEGYQGKSLLAPDSIVASVKHFAAYGAAEAGREYNTTDMSEITLRQIYLQPYQAAVQAGAATMMSAFNALNGVPATANPFLLNKVLRQEWGFNGFVVSDYTAVMELNNHGIALTPAVATEKALKAGVEVDMMSHYYDAELPELVRSGRVSLSVVDEAVRRVLRVKFACGLFEHPYAEGREVAVADPAMRPLVRRAAEESFVLLTNREQATGNSTLPLAAKAQRIALIGPLADNAHEMVGAWSGAPVLSDVVTLRQALEARQKKLGGSLNYVRGTEISSDSQAGFAAALEAARNSDVVVMALGEAAEMSGEAGSRAHLELPGNQEQLLEAVVATGKPVVLVLFSGRPLVLNWAAAHVSAMLEAWFPGLEAGNALADVLYDDVAPSGRLPMSFPRAEGQEPLYYNQLPTGRPAIGIDLSKPSVGDSRFHSRYIDEQNDALFPFGYGLSYTNFAYSGVKLSRTLFSLTEAVASKSTPLVEVTATVTNTGKRTATEVVQCYVRNLGASIEQPVRSLKGFERITLAPGESRAVHFQLGFGELSFINLEGQPAIEATHYTVWVGGNSRASEESSFDVVVPAGATAGAGQQLHPGA